MASFLGMSQSQLKKNTSLLKNMVGGIFGGFYYNITAWQQLLYQLPFGKKTSKHITRIWAMDDAEFEKPKAKSSVIAYAMLFLNILLSFIFFKSHKKKFESTYKNVFSEYENKSFSSFSNQELIADFHKLNKDLGAKWIVPVLNGFFAFLLFSLLKKVFKKSRLRNDYPNFVNDILYSQGDVISVVIVKEFQHLVNTILSNNDLKELFNSDAETDTMKRISVDYPDFKAQFDQYISNYGERCGDGELKIETINYKENPLSFISVLKANAVGSVQSKKTERHFSYKKVIREKYKYSPFKKYILLILIKATLNRIRDRENYRFYRTKGFDLVRKIFRAMDHNLYNEELINGAGDSLYLELNELTNMDIAPDYKSIISQRKADYEIYRNKNRANRYHQKGNNFIPAETIRLENVKDKVKGIACSSGIITAEVVIINSDKIENIDISGKILAANYFEPAWINLFSKASGIISERGGLLSHTAILCRELGIPAVVGAKGILSAIQQGDRVQLNGETGEIQLIKV
ncbi:MAG: hypothetical protein DRJ10_12465 [Bacteroidetes bacterium]|nr:MAG: hypothetical protein DRJ10_12465 [Bacteroidota bacterium]